MAYAEKRPNRVTQKDLNDELTRLRRRVSVLEARLVEVHDQDAALEASASELARLREAYERLGCSRDRYRELFNFIPIPCLGLDRTGTIRFANLSAAALLGHTRKALEGWPLYRFVEPDSRRALLDHLYACRTCDLPVRTELALTLGDADPMPVEIHSHRRPGDQESILTSLMDLSDRQRAEEERRRASMAQAASEAKDRFIATVSHELRGPLAPIANLLEVLKVSDEIPPSSRPLLDMIERNLWQEARLVDDLLQTSRITSHKLTLDPRDVELHPLLREIAAGLEADFRNANVELVLALEAGSDRLRADLRRLRQLFLNLLTNAKKFTPAGGRVEIRTTNPRPGQVQIGVCDTGAGLEPDQIERVFQPFEQTAIGRFGGLGLGLPIARGFAEAHGGTLEAQSEGHDKGTTFIVTLPIAGPGG